MWSYKPQKILARTTTPTIICASILSWEAKVLQQSKDSRLHNRIITNTTMNEQYQHKLTCSKRNGKRHMIYMVHMSRIIILHPLDKMLLIMNLVKVYNYIGDGVGLIYRTTCSLRYLPCVSMQSRPEKLIGAPSEELWRPRIWPRWRSSGLVGNHQPPELNSIYVANKVMLSACERRCW